MRICYLGWGGHVHLERWAGHFARAGHEVAVISVSGRGSYPEGVRQFCLEDVPASHRLRLWYLGRLLRRLKPDLVHVHWAHFATMLEGRWSGPLAVTAWGSDIYRMDGMGPGVRERLIGVLRRAELLTCDSADLARTIEETGALPEGRVEVVQWGVDTDLFAPAPEPSAFLREHGIEDQPVVLSPRNFQPLYNLETIVVAFARVVEQLPRAMLLMKYFTVEQPTMDRVRERIRALGIEDSVRILGKMPYERMPDFYRAGTTLVSIADTDATPMSMLEGMACGCVPILSDLPSLREWVRDGWNGRLVPASDPARLADAIVGLLRDADLAATFASRNLELVRERGSQRANMQRMERLMVERLAALGR